MNIVFNRSLWALLSMVVVFSADVASAETLPEVGAATVSPDGRWLVWDQRETDAAGKLTRTRVWLFDRQHPGEAQPLFPDDDYNVHQARFSADGQWIYFLSDASGTDQLWRTPTHETAAELVPL